MYIYTYKYAHTQHPQLLKFSQLIYHAAFKTVGSNIVTEQGKGRVKLLF